MITNERAETREVVTIPVYPDNNATYTTRYVVEGQFVSVVSNGETWPVRDDRHAAAVRAFARLQDALAAALRRAEEAERERDDLRAQLFVTEGHAIPPSIGRGYCGGAVSLPIKPADKEHSR
jgi:sorbitol-specific phosphotransferase system component IIBC